MALQEPTAMDGGNADHPGASGAIAGEPIAEKTALPENIPPTSGTSQKMPEPRRLRPPFAAGN